MSAQLKRIAEATRLTRQGRLKEALAMLRGVASPSERATPAEASHGGAQPSARSAPPGAAPQAPPDAAPIDVEFEVVREAPGTGFVEHRFENEFGARNYKLYKPARRTSQPMPLVVMLHGCTQSPDDFAAGTRMNEIAEERGFVVVYPAQPKSANPSKCWNWFKANEQQRDRGEPSIIAGITRHVMREHAVDARRVYVAGLSAGGAAAAILGATYPDIYAAVGVHSGLAPGAARDVPGAFTAMKQGRVRPASRDGAKVPTIVFHGDADTTVAVVNGAQVIEQALPDGLRRTVSDGVAAGGVRYTKEAHLDASGNSVLEQWTLHGAGHAWSGGSASGSFVDVRGPDASREMARFFMAHTLSAKP